MTPTICLLARSYPADRPGAPGPGLLAALAAGLGAHGASVQVLTTTDPGAVAPRAGVTLHRLRAPTSLDDELAGFEWAGIAAGALADLERAVRIDAVVALLEDPAACRVEPGRAPLVLQVGAMPRGPRGPTPLLAAAEREAIARARALVAPPGELARAVRDLGAARATVLHPPLLLPDRPLERPARAPSAPLRCAFVGGRQAIAEAIAATQVVVALARDGVDARLELVGLGAEGRRAAFEVLDRAGLALGLLTCVDGVGPDGTAALFARTDVLLAPDPAGRFDPTVALAAAAGCAVVAEATHCAGAWLAAVDPACVLLPADNGGFPAAAARWCRDAPRGVRPWRPSRDRALEQVAASYLDLLADLRAPGMLAPALVRPTRAAPRVGVVLDAEPHAPLGALARSLDSLVLRSDAPLEVALIGGRAALAWARSTYGARVALCEARADPGADAARGLDALGSDLELVVYAGVDVEFYPGWAEALAASFASDQTVGLLALATRELRGLLVPDGPLCAVRASLFGEAGRPDPAMGRLWLADFACRAARVGARVEVVAPSGLGLHRDGARPFDVDDAALARFVARHCPPVVGPTTPFLVLADATEALEDEALLATYAAAFRPGEEAALVLVGVGLDPGAYEVGLAAAAARAGLDLGAGPRVVALVPPSATPGELASLGDEIACRLGERARMAGHVPVVAAHDARRLRFLAARTWAARASLARDASERGGDSMPERSGF
ncbi:MAG TPA: hypothetical protein VKV16_07770 [Solirubrobacteraceae bacterium]|nr:hypothetical protein [Solirubrobacteraceae bacterium]